MKQDHAGFALIEVAVSLAILGVAMLAVGHQMLHSWRLTRFAGDTTQAAHLAAELGEMLRHLGDASSSGELPRSYAFDLSAAPASAVTCYSNSCTAADLFQFEMAQWFSRVLGALPGVSVHLCSQDPNTPSQPMLCQRSGTLSLPAELAVRISWRPVAPGARRTVNMPVGRVG